MSKAVDNKISDAAIISFLNVQEIANRLKCAYRKIHLCSSNHTIKRNQNTLNCTSSDTTRAIVNRTQFTTTRIISLQLLRAHKLKTVVADHQLRHSHNIYSDR